MSKQSEAKARQGYRTEPPHCGICAHFSSIIEEVKREWSDRTWTRERELRCSLGGFAVKKNGYCDKFWPKESAR